MEWPPDYREANRKRLHRIRALKLKPEAWVAARKYYATRPVEFIEDWCVTFDPRRKGLKTVPFLLFPKQRDFVAWLTARFEQRENGMVTKCRDMGVSWICCAWAAWAWIFKPGIKIGFGSLKELKVDRLGDADTLFEKLRIILRHLPKQLLPAGYKESEHAGYMRIINPVLESAITGEAGDNIGRGGRTSIYFLDEAAHITHPQQVDAALDDNSDCKIHVSTHNGTGTAFYRKWKGGHWPVFDFKWRDHPEKDDAWYQKQKLERDPANLAQEVDNDPEASIENVVIPSAWVRAARTLKGIKPEGLRVAGMDVGGGSAFSVFIVRQGPVIEMPTAWTQPDIIDTGTFAADLFDQKKVVCLNYDSYGIGTGVMATLRRIPHVRAQGINTGQQPTDAHWLDGQTSKQKFLNLKAELWWLMRDRFYKTWQHVQYLEGQGGKEHPLDELVCVPDHDQLCSELSVVTWYTTPSGKIQIETKDELAKRGVKSPDFADAMALTFAPVRGELRAVQIRGLY